MLLCICISLSYTIELIFELICTCWNCLLFLYVVFCMRYACFWLLAHFQRPQTVGELATCVKHCDTTVSMVYTSQWRHVVCLCSGWRAAVCTNDAFFTCFSFLKIKPIFCYFFFSFCFQLFLLSRKKQQRIDSLMTSHSFHASINDVILV